MKPSRPVEHLAFVALVGLVEGAIHAQPWQAVAGVVYYAAFATLAVCAIRSLRSR